MEYDYIVFIGRFQPFHKAHKRIMDIALKQSEKVVVLIGSAGESRSYKNPFTFEERKGLIRSVYPDGGKVFIKSLWDNPYDDDVWVQNAKHSLYSCDPDIFGKQDIKIGLIGCKTDSSSYYLDLFPNWEFIEVENVHIGHAKDLRADFFEYSFQWNHLLTNQTKTFLEKFKLNNKAEYERLSKEHLHVKNYDSKRYEPTFVATDWVIKKGNKLLFITRKSDYGKGLIAFPGGFVNADETVLKGGLRELKEETGIRLDRPDIEIKGGMIADNPNRDLRARIISQVFFVDIPDGIELNAKAGDDAESVLWLSGEDIAKLGQEKFFGDHYHLMNMVLRKNNAYLRIGGTNA